MTRRWFRGVLLVVLAGHLTGCAWLLVGAGAAGGYAISRDSITNRFEQPPDVIYDVSRDVLHELGFVMAADDSRHRLQGTVEGATVTITITPVSAQMAELKVRARNRFLMPRITVAHTVYNAIIRRLK